eukprot:TRINITY_DN2394_c1_g1_i2.p2 TRINITY_DN2394_c1_g1~~TRINITY_DN2394_c1_g1_i2.p2  ORF type:complete len:123 (-),score=23.29 TRINITY_DN2394_c1_g1_i2:379-747(-)
MRLAPPKFGMELPVFTETLDRLGLFDETKTDFYGTANDTRLTSDTPQEEWNPSMASLGFSESLLLPSSFGNIYLGENFKGFFNVSNISNEGVHIVNIKVKTDRERVVWEGTSWGGWSGKRKK